MPIVPAIVSNFLPYFLMNIKDTKELNQKNNIKIAGMIDLSSGAIAETTSPPYDIITLIPAIGHRKAKKMAYINALFEPLSAVTSP